MLEYEGGIVRDTLIPRRSLKLGETIRIKPLKVIEEVRNRNFDFSNGFVVGMHKYCGKVGKITRVSEDFFCGYDANSYRIDLDGGRYWWSVHMFDWENKGIMENE